MKKSRVAPYLLAAALVLALASGALAQRGPAAGRPAQGRRGVDRANQIDPQLGRPRTRFPDDPRVRGGLPRLDQAQKRQLKQRLMQAIGLTPEQHARIQEIRRSHEDEIIATGRRLREARRQLDRAIMSEQYDEALINRQAEELARAQADKIRLDARIRAQVRGVLTTEQVVRFHQLEREMRQRMREQQREEREQE
jgi:Spy/CpxP family protein refolding chaperone